MVANAKALILSEDNTVIKRGARFHLFAWPFVIQSCKVPSTRF